VKRNAALAMFRFSPNLFEKATGRTPDFAKRQIVRAGGARVSITGLSTPDTPNVTWPRTVDLKFTDPAQATIRTAAELRALGVDAVVVVAHMGGRCSKLHDPNDLASCEPNHRRWICSKNFPPEPSMRTSRDTPMRRCVITSTAFRPRRARRSAGSSRRSIWIDPAKDKVVKSEIRPHTMICAFVYEGTEQCDPRTAPKGATLVPRVFGGETVVRTCASRAPSSRIFCV
jgi:5'-nucleotidase